MANLKKNFESCVIKVEGVVQRVGFRRFVEIAVEFYVFKCDEHGIVADYPHREEQILECPLCASLRYSDLDSESYAI